MQASKRVMINSGILYGRLILTMAIALYSTRLVLNALGSKDYGIFNLIAGVIAMLSFLNAAMTTSTQRFLSYSQGKREPELQNKIFTNSFTLHVIIGLIIVAGLELLGLFFFNGLLNIPPARMQTAILLFHFMSATVFFTVINVPFTATLNAHENMGALASVSIMEALLKFGNAFLISHVNATDKLLLYGILTECVTMLSFAVYLFLCTSKYKECSLKFWKNIDWKLMKELTSFAGWNLFGALCGLGKTQGLAVILNIFFGTVVNAAYGITNQIAGQFAFLSSTVLQAINPQIMKSEGAGDTDRMLRLSMTASKFSFFLMAMLCIPVMFEMTAILKFWLKTVPPFTVIFAILVLSSVLINQLTVGLQSAIQATGKVKVYQATVGSLILLNVPIAYMLLRFGLPAYTALISFSVIEAIACMFRMYFAKKTSGLSILTYIKRVLLMEIIPVLSAIIFCYLFTTYCHFSFRFVFTVMLSSLVFIISIYFTGLYGTEKELIVSAISATTRKFTSFSKTTNNL